MGTRKKLNLLAALLLIAALLLSACANNTGNNTNIGEIPETGENGPGEGVVEEEGIGEGEAVGEGEGVAEGEVVPEEEVAPEGEVGEDVLEGEALDESMVGNMAYAEGQELGVIESVVRDGRQRYAVLNYNNQFVPVPAGAFAQDTTTNQLVYQSEFGLLAQAPGFASVEEVDPTAAGFNDVRDFWAAEGLVEGTGSGLAQGELGEGVDFDICNPYRMDNLLAFNIIQNTEEGAVEGLGAETGLILGDIEALVILRPSNTAYGLEDEGVFTQGGAQGSVSLPTTAPAPVIGYVIFSVVDEGLNELNLGTGNLMVPYSALNVEEAVVGEAARLGEGICGFTLTFDQAELANAPMLQTDEWTIGEGGWNEEVDTWAEGLGLTAPTLGGEAGMNNSQAVVLEDGVFDQIDIDVQNLQEEGLGEVEDFFIDPASGQLRYALLETGEVLGLGGRTIPVPINHLLWVDEDDDFNDLGEIIIPVDQAVFDAAPAIDDPSLIDFTDETWDDAYDTYWGGVTTE